MTDTRIQSSASSRRFECRGRPRPSARSRAAGSSARRRRTASRRARARANWASSTPSANPTTAPSAKPDRRLLRGEERRVPEELDQQRRRWPAPARTARRRSRADAGIVDVVDRRTATSSRSPSRASGSPPRAPRGTASTIGSDHDALESSSRRRPCAVELLDHAVESRACRSTLPAPSTSCEELRELTGDENGAQRVAWTETWERARGGSREKLARPCRVDEEIDEAGNEWFTLPRRVRARAADRRAHRLGAERRLARRLPQRDGGRRGAAADRGGGRAAGHGAARRLGRRGGRALRPLAVRLVGRGRLDARPGRAARSSPTATASPCRTRSPSTASSSTGRSTRAAQLENAAAYLELHIEQGPVLESLDLPLGVVLGTFGVERSRVTWTGQAAHAGSTPMDERRDALAGAAKLALEIRGHRARGGRRRRLHLGRRRLQAGDRHLGRRDGRAAARPAPSRRGQLARDARARAGRCRSVRGRGAHRGRVGADLADRADPLRRRR